MILNLLTYMTSFSPFPLKEGASSGINSTQVVYVLIFCSFSYSKLAKLFVYSWNNKQGDGCARLYAQSEA